MPDILAIRDLTKIYPNGKQANLGLNLQVGSGETVGIIGANGAGKTTLIRQILGLVKPSSGEIEVHGRLVNRNPRAVKGLIGYVPQSPLYYPALTVEESISHVLELAGNGPDIIEQKTRKTVELLGLHQVRNLVGYQLSGGLKKLLLLAMALCQDAPLLIMDEPTSMVDVVNKARIWETIATLKGTCVLLASHDLNEIRRLCDRAYLLVDGRIAVEGTPEQIAASLELPAHVRFVPVDEQNAEKMLNGAGVFYTRAGAAFDAEFPRLKECIGFLKHLSDHTELSHVLLDAPSFEKAVVRLMGGDVVGKDMDAC